MSKEEQKLKKNLYKALTEYFIHNAKNNLSSSVSIPIEISILFGNSEHPFPERKNMPFRSRVQPFI